MVLSSGKGLVKKKGWRNRDEKPDLTQFVSIFTDEVVGVFDYFSGFLDDVEMVSVDIY
jgi:hypothetical protein